MNPPENFGTVTPYIFVDDPSAFGEFIKHAFDGDEVGRTVAPDGLIANLQIRIGNMVIMISQTTADYPAMASAYCLYVEDANRTMASAIAAGAKLEMDVADMPYDDRQGGIRDPFGNIWWITQRLIDQPYH